MTRVELVDAAVTRELRRSVLRPQLGLGDPLPGDDVDAVHLAALDEDGAALCTCFVFPEPCPWLPEFQGAWHLRQMATLPERRGEGLGRGVLAAVDHYLREQHAQLVWCFARESARGFYQACGYQVHGPVFTDERHTIPHRRLWRELSAQPVSS